MATEADDTGTSGPGGGSPPPAVPVRVAKGPPPGRRRAVVGLLLVAGLAAAAVVALGNRDRSATATLAAARSAVDDAGSFHFDQHITWEAEDGDLSTTLPAVYRSADEGEWIDGVWHVVSSDGSSATETIVQADGTVYHRSDGATATGAVDAREPWDAVGVGDEVGEVGLVASLEGLATRLEGLARSDETLRTMLDEVAVRAAVVLYLRGGGSLDGFAALGRNAGPAFGPGATPMSYLDAIDDLGEPALDGARTLTATLQAPDEVAEALGHTIPDGRIEVDLGPHDLPSEVRLDVAAGSSSAEVELAFSNWGAPLVVATPSGDGVDTTPWLEEDDLRAIDVVPLLPTGLLESDGLRVISGRASDRFAEGPVDCDLLEVSNGGFVTPASPSDAGDALLLLETSRRCALAVDATPFEPGGPGGLPSRPAASSVQVLVGDTMVEIHTTLSGPRLDELAASLAPVPVETLVTAASERPEGWSLDELRL